MRSKVYDNNGEKIKGNWESKLKEIESQDVKKYQIHLTKNRKQPENEWEKTSCQPSV